MDVGNDEGILKMDERNELPQLSKGWMWTTLGNVCSDPQYGWTTSAATEGNLHLLRTTDITSGEVDWNSVPFCKNEPPEKEKYLLRDGDIVISRAGSVGFSHLMKEPKEAIFASYLIRFRPQADKKYVAYFLQSPLYWRSISEQSLGIAIPNVNASKLKQIHLPLAPLPEQHRIVAKIEELFSDLDAGVAALKKVQAQLKRYRQAVLKAAVEGKLTAKWRAANAGKVETASALLERIRAERVTVGAAPRARPARGTNGGVGGDGAAQRGDRAAQRGDHKGAPQRNVPMDAAELPALPEGWVWTRLDEITNNFDGRRIPIKDDKRSKGNYPYYGAQGIIDYVADFIFDGGFLLVAEDGANLFS